MGGIPSLLVLDMTRDDWIRVPRPWRDRDWRQSPTIVNTRRDLIVFGGARWNRAHTDGELLKDAWIWTPPRPG